MKNTKQTIQEKINIIHTILGDPDEEFNSKKNIIVVKNNSFTKQTGTCDRINQFKIAEFIKKYTGLKTDVYSNCDYADIEFIGLPNGIYTPTQFLPEYDDKINKIFDENNE